MNICMIIDCLDFGGAERVVLTLADQLLTDEHCVTIITIDPIDCMESFSSEAIAFKYLSLAADSSKKLL